MEHNTELTKIIQKRVRIILVGERGISYTGIFVSFDADIISDVMNSGCAALSARAGLVACVASSTLLKEC